VHEERAMRLSVGAALAEDEQTSDHFACHIDAG
jgi:hypothetical protein